MNKLFDEKYYIDRLKAEYEKYGTLIVAIDFDGTLFDLYGDGIEVQPIVDLIRRCNRHGFATCLWTAVTDEWSLIYKKAICGYMGLEFKYYNESPAINKSRKPHFSILLDDRAGLESAYNILIKTMDELNLK